MWNEIEVIRIGPGDFGVGCVCKKPSQEEQNGVNFSFIYMYSTFRESPEYKSMVFGDKPKL